MAYKLQSFLHAIVLFTCAIVILQVKNTFWHAGMIPVNRTSELHMRYIAKLFNTESAQSIRPICSALIQGEHDVQLYATAAQHGAESMERRKPELYFTKLCPEIVENRYLTNESLLPENERSLSIAFSIMTYERVLPQLEKLLRAIYRPHHFYCIHIDAASSNATLEAIQRLAACFPNVFVPLNRIEIVWGTISQVDAELVCMKHLYSASDRWKYFINLTGQEFPLKTMWQLVRILQALNGSNSMEGTVMKNDPQRRKQFESFGRKYNIKAVKGATHMVVVRGFVNYVLHSSIAKSMREHLESAMNPDETFFATLNHNPRLKVPGGYLGKPETDPETYPFINRLKVWSSDFIPCLGIFRNGVCVWDVRGLPFITNSSRKELFVNKLFWYYQPLALDCLEWYIWNMTIAEYGAYWTGQPTHFESSYYENLAITKNHFPS